MKQIRHKIKLIQDNDTQVQVVGKKNVTDQKVIRVPHIKIEYIIVKIDVFKLRLEKIPKV